jgi:hypothetical protein
LVVLELEVKFPFYLKIKRRSKGVPWRDVYAVEFDWEVNQSMIEHREMDWSSLEIGKWLKAHNIMIEGERPDALDETEDTG